MATGACAAFFNTCNHCLLALPLPVRTLSSPRTGMSTSSRQLPLGMGFNTLFPFLRHHPQIEHEQQAAASWHGLQIHLSRSSPTTLRLSTSRRQLRLGMGFNRIARRCSGAAAPTHFRRVRLGGRTHGRPLQTQVKVAIANSDKDGHSKLS